MLKFTITIKDDKNGMCKVNLEPPKNLEKCSENEKQVGGAVFTTINNSLKELKEKN